MDVKVTFCSSATCGSKKYRDSKFGRPSVVGDYVTRCLSCQSEEFLSHEYVSISRARSMLARDNRVINKIDMEIK